MFGFLFRFIGCLILAAGTAFAIGDIARSLSAEALRLITVAEGVGLVSGAGLADGASGAGALNALGQVGTLIAGWPIAPSLAALAVLFLLFGQRRPAPSYQR